MQLVKGMTSTLSSAIKQAQADTIADELIKHINKFYSKPRRDERDTQKYIFESYLKLWEEGYETADKPVYFTPSSVGSDPLGLFARMSGAKKDKEEHTPPHQGRWKVMGNAIGDMIQRDLIMAETQGNFAFQRTDKGYPAFEEFNAKNHSFVHEGTEINIYGMTDGLMYYKNTPFGLEIKSKQTTSASTSKTSLKEAKYEHIQQCILYSIMFNVDYFVILYVNASKKAWGASEEDLEKTPDVRAFGLYITEEMRTKLKDFMKFIVDSVNKNQPPGIDLRRWTFNNYKDACIEILKANPQLVAKMDSDIDYITGYKYPAFIKKAAESAYVEITERLQS